MSKLAEELATAQAEADARRDEKQARRAASLRQALDIKAAIDLEDYMSAISEDGWCAGWLIGLEFILWNALDGGDALVSPADIEVLQGLSKAAGGWWIYDEFIPLERWKQLYAEYKK